MPLNKAFNAVAINHATNDLQILFMAFANRPVRIFAVIRVNEQPIRRELKTFHQHRALKRKDINAVTFKVVFETSTKM